MLTVWQCKLNREAIMNGAEGAEEQKVKHNSKRVTVAEPIEVSWEDMIAGKSPKTDQAWERMLDLTGSERNDRDLCNFDQTLIASLGILIVSRLRGRAVQNLRPTD